MSLKLHELPADKGKRQNARRVGRGEGSGHGKTCARGHKGAQSRSGGAKGGAFEGGQTPLVRRVPKFGFTNLSFRALRAEITLGQLERFEDGAVVDPKALHAAGLIPKGAERIKVIATGNLTKRLTVKAHGFSKGARAAIEDRGGACEAAA